jgi:hypothetical protein
METFWNKVNKIEGGCWEWTACLNEKGYGRFRYEWKLYKAHRFSYYLHHPVSENIENIKLEVLHTCDNRKCVNPYHLRLDTHKNNIQDKILKDRQPYGEQHYASKLTDTIVREVFAKFEENKNDRHIRQTLAKEYGISRQRIDDIVNGKWRHTPIISKPEPD